MSRTLGAKDVTKRLRRGDGQEIARLGKLPLTDLGRRILMRHALTTRTGHVGAKNLAEILGCHEVTIWKILKVDNALWYEDPRLQPIADRLCKLLRCDRSWLYDRIDYGGLGEVSFDINRRWHWHVRKKHRQHQEESHV